MIAPVSNKTTFELKTARGFPSSLYPNFIQNPQTFNQKAVKTFVEIEFPDFDYKFKLEIVSQLSNSNKIKQKLEIAKGVFLNLQLIGKLAKKPEKRFYIDDISLNLEIKSQCPTSNFIASSFSAMIGLSKINFPWINNGVGSFPESVNKISTHLQNRQFSHRLMVIEKALKISFSIPKREIDRAEINYISYCYHSIVDRKFEFEADSQHSIGETETKHFVGELFGSKVDLGIHKVSIAKRGVSEVESITTPTLPKNAFSKDIQKLIDLETKLIDALFEKHLNTFSNAFEGLSDEQIEALTERPILEEEAFNF